MKVVVALVSLCLVGCAAPQLRQEGAAVRVSTEQRIESCTYLGPATAEVGSNFRSYEDNVAFATNEVRNKAAAMGATDVIVGSPSKTSTNGWSNRCNNCVALTAQAYVCNGSTPAARATASLPRGMGEERGDCYPNHTCNDGLTCLSDLCVLAAGAMPVASAPPSAEAPPAPSPEVVAELAPPAPPITVVHITNLDDARAAEEIVRGWKGKKLRAELSDGRTHEDRLTALRGMRCYFQGGTSIPLEGIRTLTVIE